MDRPAGRQREEKRRKLPPPAVIYACLINRLLVWFVSSSVRFIRLSRLAAAFYLPVPSVSFRTASLLLLPRRLLERKRLSLPDEFRRGHLRRGGEAENILQSFVPVFLPLFISSNLISMDGIAKERKTKKKRGNEIVARTASRRY